MTSLLGPALMALLGLLGQAPGPIDLQGEILKGVCTIPLSYQGRTMRFLIDTGNPRSGLSVEDSKYLMGRAGMVSEVFNPIGLPIGSVCPDNSGFFRYKDGFDGVLGFDVLKNLAFGIDYQTGAVRFWPAAAPPSDAINWIKEGSTKPVVGLQLLPSNKGFAINTDLGFALIATGLSYTCFPPSQQDKGTITLRGIHEVKDTERGLNLMSTTHILKNFTVGGLNLPYRSFVMDPTRKTAAVAAQVLGSKRIVFDFPSHAIYLSRPDHDAMLVSMFSDLTDSSARMESNEICLEDPDQHGSYLPVETIAGVSIPEFIKAIDSGDDTAVKTFANLYDSYFNGCDIVLRDKNVTKTVHIKSGWPK